MNLIILGQRLKKIRECLEFSQLEIAEKVHCKQNSISNLELGKGGNIELFLNLFDFYSSYLHIELLFSENFYFTLKEINEEDNKPCENWIAVKVINQSKEEFQKRSEVVFKEFFDNLDKAIKLIY